MGGLQCNARDRHVHGFATEVQVESQSTFAGLGGIDGALEFRQLLNYQ